MTATMSAPETASARILRFGAFEVDLQVRELRRRGLRVKLQQKPFQILELLLTRPGELVTRKEVAQHLWPGVHVNFDRSLNTAVNALRRALADSPRNPRYLETRSGLGYRFIAPVEKISDAQEQRHAASIDSIAVLPFINAGGSPALNSLTDGIAESIIAALSSDTRLRIVAHSSAFRYRANDQDAVVIGKDLNVRAVLTGRVAERAGSLNVSAELVDVATRWRLWGAQYECSASRISGIEADIAAALAGKLRVHLNGGERSTIGTGNLEAYQDYLKGRYFYGKMSEDALRKSVAYFKSALEADPRYALAYAGLADTYTLFAFLDLMRAAEALPQARDLAETALQIDPQLPEAHASLAGIKKLFEWDWAGSEGEYRRALQLNPNLASAHHWYADHLSTLGRFEEAISEIRRAQELDPLSLVINNEVAWNLYMARDFEGALEQAWKTLALEPRFAPAQHTLGLANEQLGNLEEAIVEFQNSCACSGNHPGALAALAHAHAQSGATGEAQKILHDLTDISKRRHVSPYWLSLVHTALGDHDAAFDLLHRGIEERDVWMVWLNVEPRFDALRADGRFKDLLRSLRLA